MSEIDNLVYAIKDATTIAIISHINPDPDTICSALALKEVLIKMDKKVHLYCESKITGKASEIQGVEFFNKDYSPYYQLCICVDCAEITRIGDDYDVFVSAKKTANIDHHISNTKFANINLIEPYAAATCQLLYKVILRLDPTILNDHIAELLYMGIVADSGAFTFSNTTNETMQIAGELLRFNFDSSAICYNLVKKIKKRVFNLKLRAFQTMQFYEKNSIGIIKFDIVDFKCTRTEMGDTSGMINDILNIDQMKIAIAISEKSNNVYKISLRSKDKIDISKVARIFGGGGHINASGCELYGEYNQILTRLLKECAKVL